MAVLTNFTRNDVESRLYWPRGGMRAGPSTREGWLARPTGSEGWVLGHASTLQSPPLQPLQGFRARSAGIAGFLARCRRLGSTPRITHPVYPPQYPYPARTPSRLQCSLHVHSARYSGFWTSVGEPRGMRTHRYIQALTAEAWIYTLS